MRRIHFSTRNRTLHVTKYVVLDLKLLDLKLPKDKIPFSATPTDAILSVLDTHGKIFQLILHDPNSHCAY